jgi:hypothetical protein
VKTFLSEEYLFTSSCPSRFGQTILESGQEDFICNQHEKNREKYRKQFEIKNTNDKVEEEHQQLIDQLQTKLNKSFTDYNYNDDSILNASLILNVNSLQTAAIELVVLSKTSRLLEYKNSTVFELSSGLDELRHEIFELDSIVFGVNGNAVQDIEGFGLQVFQDLNEISCTETSRENKTTSRNYIQIKVPRR